MRKIVYILILFFLVSKSFCQEKIHKTEKLIQFSGLVLTSDSNLPVPFATLKIINSHRGTVANIQGFFAIVAKVGDVVEFSSIGYKKRRVFIPDNIIDQKYTILVSMEADTIMFEETVIYPLPSKEKFKEAFLHLEVSKDKSEILKENYNVEKMMAIRLNMQMDGSENQHYFQSLYAQNARYYGGQTEYGRFPNFSTPIPLSLLNPLAWAEFIKDLKNGKLKDKYKYLRE